MLPREFDKYYTIVCLRQGLVVRVLEDEESVIFTPRGLPEGPHPAALPDLYHPRVHAARAPGGSAGRHGRSFGLTAEQASFEVCRIAGVWCTWPTRRSSSGQTGK